MIYLFNLLLAGCFTYFTFSIYPKVPNTALNAVIAFLGWYILLWLLSFFYNVSHFKKVPRAISLFFYYLKQLISASFRVAYDVVTFTHHMNAGVLAFPMEAKTDLEITLLANFITLTPGSLSIGVSEDRSILYIHETYIEKHGDIEKHKQALKNGLEKRILKLTR